MFILLSGFSLRIPLRTDSHKLTDAHYTAAGQLDLPDSRLVTVEHLGAYETATGTRPEPDGSIVGGGGEQLQIWPVVDREERTIVAGQSFGDRTVSSVVVADENLREHGACGYGDLNSSVV